MAEEGSNTLFFLNGVLIQNGATEHAFFDIKARKHTGQSLQVSLYTADIPPIPVKYTDELHTAFFLESNVGFSTVRYRVAEATFKGSMMAKEKPCKGGKFLSIMSDSAEWHFMKQPNQVPDEPSPNSYSPDNPTIWILYFISIRVPSHEAKKFISKLTKCTKG
mmetsp:Transcript_46604/g.117354  ORF Transcript_46604/g.117354 Transcript_46604/m.117354 type:complete len:163 (+) Transcript_46604:114-602(+)|eukprot:CAMPEP_0177667890 /NCGR_PEP_ID=MMETSP0447-20121125/22397_1 /TAXON_ID=0 /ORGANISM="Stygamoeba regulata, Strain BSH-02190019" /LENGTH=162 /DNA_ID=CAMNT_0019174217 /DNA_START=56 /DNA_END=544 /DNA_ORIENTATION=+